MKRASVLWFVASLLLGLAGQASAAVSLYRVTDLGDLPGGDYRGVGNAVNANALVVGRGSTDDGTHAIVSSGGVMTDIGALLVGRHYSVANDVNDAGVVVGASAIDDKPENMLSQRPFIYFGGIMTNPGSFGGDYGAARGVNNLGQVVGISRYANGVTHAFVYSGATMTDLGSLEGTYGFSDAYGINNYGQIVGVAALNGQQRGFLWQNGTMTDLGDLAAGAGQTRAYRINDSGQVVGESWSDDPATSHAFLWQNGTMTDLGVLSDGSFGSWGLDISDQGVVVGKSFGAASERAIVWDSLNGMRDLNSLTDGSGTGWTLRAACGINNREEIVGWGTNAGGEIHAVLLTPVPEPSSLVMWIGLAPMGLWVVWRRRRGVRGRHLSALFRRGRAIFRKALFSLGVAVAMVLSAGMQVYAQSPSSTPWVRQLGTSGNEQGFGVSADALGNIWIAGRTSGALDGTSIGSWDAFVAKYNASGTPLWVRQLGTPQSEWACGVSADGLGNVYISGYTDGSLGGTNAGSSDAFIAKYNTSGSLLWTRQFGTSSEDQSSSVSADGLGNVYISGYTYGPLGGTNAGVSDAFVAKYDAMGNPVWVRQLGTLSQDVARGVSADGLGDVYISGYTYGPLGGTKAGNSDAFMAKYDASGSLLWTREFGTSSEDTQSYAISADGRGNVYMSGFTNGSLGGTNAGKNDALVAKYDASGNLLWTRQLGTPGYEQSYGVSADELGNVFISGWTDGSLGGTAAGSGDAFAAEYNAAGEALWTRQLGTSSDDGSYSVSADGLGNAYISGYTGGSLGAVNVGSDDAFVAFLPAIPEPSTLITCSVLGALTLSVAWWRRRRPV